MFTCHVRHAHCLQLRVDKDEHISRLQDQAASCEAQLQAEAEALSAELMGRIDSLQTELDGVLEFKQRRVSGSSLQSSQTKFPQLQLAAGILRQYGQSTLGVTARLEGDPWDVG
jgi:hypothetical protein